MRRKEDRRVAIALRGTRERGCRCSSHVRPQSGPPSLRGAGVAATPRGQQWPPACTLPHVRDGLRVRCKATLCPCGRSSLGRLAPRPFLRNALPDLTTIVPVTAYYRINYVRDTGGLVYIMPAT